MDCNQDLYFTKDSFLEDEICVFAGKIRQLRGVMLIWSRRLACLGALQTQPLCVVLRRKLVLARYAY